MTSDSAVKALLEAGAYPGDSDGIELAIMKLPGFDFDTARSIIATVMGRLNCHYELDRHRQYADINHHLGELCAALADAEEPEVDPRHDEDEIADDPRRL